jgi:ribosome-binding protein aMBF1 (putative translation factor)
VSTPRRKRSRNASAALPCRTRLQQGKIDPMSTTQRHDVALAFGALVRELRTAQGLTQEGLAEKGGFHRTYPSLLERGLRTPTLSVLFRLADTLGVSAPALVQCTLIQLHREAVPAAPD